MAIPTPRIATIEIEGENPEKESYTRDITTKDTEAREDEVSREV